MHHSNPKQLKQIAHILSAVDPTPCPGINLAGRAGDSDRRDIKRLGVYTHCAGWGFFGRAGRKKI